MIVAFLDIFYSILYDSVSTSTTYQTYALYNFSSFFSNSLDSSTSYHTTC